MKQKRTEKGEVSRSALIEAATKLFAVQGYHVTKVSDIVKAAGLTQAAFYLYFPSKEAIFEEIIQRYKQQLKQLTNTGALVTNLPAHEVQGQVQQNLLNLFHFFQSQPELSKIALLDSPDRFDMKSEIVQQVKTNLKANQKAGIIRENLDLEVAAECMVSLIEMVVLKIVYGEENPTALAAKMMDIVLYGIAHRPKQEEEENGPFT